MKIIDKPTKILTILIMLISFTVILIGCDLNQTKSTDIETVNVLDKTEPQRSYSYESCFVKIREPWSDLYVSQIMKFSYVEHSVHYFFSEIIESQGRNQFIDSQKLLLTYLNTSHYFEKMPSITYYLIENYPSVSQSKYHKAYFNTNDISSFNQVLITLQSIYGDEVNYGLLYGLSNHIASELGWITDTQAVTKKEILDFTNNLENKDLLFIEYPSFLSLYNEKNQQEVKTISMELVNYMLENSSIEAITSLIDTQGISQSTFDNEWTNTINSWLIAIGSDTQLVKRNTPIAFANGGSVAPLIIYTAHGKYILQQDYNESQLRETKIDYFKTDLPTLLFAVETIEKDMDSSDLLFKDPNKKYHPYSIVLCSYQQAMEGSGAFAYYSPRDYTSFNSSVMAISHEYIHYLTTPLIGYNWQYESIAIYYNLPAYFQKIASNDSLDNIRSDYNNEALDLREYLGRDFQVEDFPTFCDIAIVNNHLNEVNETNPFAMISISNYVKNTYGDETLRQIFLNQDTIEEEISLTWEDLIAEWNQWLIDTYDN